VGEFNVGMTTSASAEWGTPQWLFDQLDAEFAFDLDPCCTVENAKCARHFTASDDGLSQEWTGTVYMNPPYGRGIDQWMRKAWETWQAGHTVVCLVPARTDTAWWHDYAAKGDVRFLRGRLTFDGIAEKGHNAPFPSAVVVFRGHSA
jgi:phage N-6-adenine-methyltransferase